MHRLSTLMLFTAIALVTVTMSCSSTWALNSCARERPSEVVSFEQGSSSPEIPLSPDVSDPRVLFRPSSDLESLNVGLGGSLTVKFTVPIANYPAAGSLTIERPGGTLPCSSYPVRAEVSGSIDGVHFIPLGTTCESAAFDLGTLSWIAYLRIKDVTDPSDPAFGTQPITGFTLRAISGPGCLKHAHCAASASPDPTVTNTQKAYALSLSHIGDDFVLEDGASFEEYGNGTARLLGSAYRTNNPSSAYDLILSLTGRVQSPPSQSPILELFPSAYSSQGGTIDPSLWYYYKRWSGILIGKGSLTGEEILIKDTIHAAQIGDGANGRNRSFGLSGSFSYGSSRWQGTGDLKLDLTSCSPPPPPTPPSGTPLPTPTPSHDTQSAGPTCAESDLTNKLLRLDGSLFQRLDTVNRATRLLVRENRSRRHMRYRARMRSRIQNLYVLAWRDVWKHERIVRTCLPSVLCFDVHLEPSQAAVATSARLLDSAVDTSLSYVRRRITSRKAKRALKRLVEIHADQHSAFMNELAGLPRHSTSCREEVRE